MERVKAIASHFTGPASGLAALEKKSPDDVVVTMAIRTPLCKAKKGSLKDVRYVTHGLVSSVVAHRYLGAMNF